MVQKIAKQKRVNALGQHMRKAGMLLLASTALMAGAILPSQQPAQAAPQLILGTGNVESETQRRPFILRTAMGEPFGDQDMLGKFTLIYFGYTSCPDVCPTALMTMSTVLDGLGDDAKAMTPIFISVDPDRDDAASLHDYTTAFHPQITGMTGPKVMVDAAVDAFNARYKFIPTDDEDPTAYSVDHSSSMTFVGPNGKIITRFGYGLPEDEIVKRIKEEIANFPKLVRKLKARAHPR